MWTRCGLNTHRFAALLLGLGLWLGACTMLRGAGRDPTGQPLYDIVAVGRSRGKILLAALASPADKRQWRFRELPVSPSSAAVQNVELSAGATKALVVFSDGVTRVFDLTERITAIDGSNVPPPQHRLPQQRFVFLSNEKACLLDDSGARTAEDCVEATDAAVHEDGRVLYALKDGRLVVAAANGGSQEQLAYNLPDGVPFQLLAGHRGDARDFLILLNEPQKPQNGKTGNFITNIIDPRHADAPIGQYDSSVVAALRAQLDFGAPVTGESAAARAANVSDATLATLAANLSQEAPGEFVWSFYRVASNTELYAPIFELAEGEPDFPTNVDIWEQIRPLAKGNSRESYETAYASMGDRRWSRCAYYVRVLSYPGTWLIEYWFYYPFDEGRPHAHIHDSEHMFIEVDKLGGTVRNDFASDHDSFVPNNLYSTLVKGAPPVTLPLFAMAEFGKHAMSPDLNHDGRFTRGVDDHLHIEPYSFWGIRDRARKSQAILEPYRASMSLPRNRAGRFALADAADLFPNVDVPAEHQVCSVQPFPDDPPCTNCDVATAPSAATYLIDHPDAIIPENIYKPYVLPYREFRIGVGIFDWSEGREEISLGYVGDFRHMTGGLLPIPARLALEFGWKPVRALEVAPFNGSREYLFSRSTLFAGARIERFLTNTQGFYVGVTPKWVDISTRVVNGAPVLSARYWEYGGMSYHVGYILELPSAHKGNFTNLIGVVIRDTPQTPVMFEWRVSFGFLRRRGRNDFGARRGDRNPYE
jgi:hypothetical protein